MLTDSVNNEAGNPENQPPKKERDLSNRPDEYKTMGVELETIKQMMENPDFDMSLVKDEFAKRIVSRFVDYIEIDEEFKNEYMIKDLTIHAYFDYKEAITLSLTLPNILGSILPT